MFIMLKFFQKKETVKYNPCFSKTEQENHLYIIYIIYLEKNKGEKSFLPPASSPAGRLRKVLSTSLNIIKALFIRSLVRWFAGFCAIKPNTVSIANPYRAGHKGLQCAGTTIDFFATLNAPHFPPPF